MRSLLALLLAALLATAAQAQAVLYVDADAAPGGDGASWASAFRDLKDALAAAEAGDELWIAEGVYKPTQGGDRTATFTLASGVALYGGFDGTETMREERDWTAHVTVLSGDVGAPGDSTDNAYHVVTASGVDRTAVLDGLTVQHGQANVAVSERDRGAGVLAVSGSPTIRNARFRWNRASVGGGLQRGGGVYVEDGSPLVEDVLFEGNAGGGAGLFASGGAPELWRVAFRGNRGSSALGFSDGSTGLVVDALIESSTRSGVYVLASSPVFRRVTIRDNVTGPAPVDGPGVFINYGAAPVFEDCLFENLRTRHDLAGSGGGVFVRWDGEVSSPVFIRTTFRGNTASQGGGIRLHPSDALFLYCRFEGNRALAGGGLAGYETAVTVIGSTFVGNRAEPIGTGGSGGGLDLAFAPLLGGRSLVASTLFAGNTGRRGAAVNLAGVGAVPVDLVNVTFAGNEASEGGGALRLRDAAGAALSNVVLWGNEAPEGPEVYVPSGAGPTIERAILAGGCPVGATCTDVLDEDPLFERAPSPGPDGEWGTEDDDYGDLRLRPGSPAIDYGLTELLPPDRWDLDGDGDTEEPLPIDVVAAPRIRGAEVDLGAYESPGTAPVTVQVATPGEAVVIGPYGGAFEFAVVLTNTTGEAQAVEVWSAVEGPVALAPVLGPLGLVLPAGARVARRVVQAVPAGAPSGSYTYRVRAGGFPGAVVSEAAFHFAKAGASPDVARVEGAEGWTASGWGEAAAPVPEVGVALSVGPNPFRGKAAVVLSLSSSAEVSVSVYDALGRRVAVVAEGRLSAGRYTFPLGGAGLPAGVYVVRAASGGTAVTETVTVLR